MRQRKSISKKKIVVLSTLVVASLFMAVGYSILSQKITLQGKANLRAADKYLWHKITTDYLSTSGSGFYENTTESKKYSYIGDGASNYIKIGNDTWRIVSVEADHTIKIVKLDTSINKEFDTNSNRTAENSTYCTDLTNGCNAWNTKESFTNGDITGRVENDSTLLTYLNNDFYNSLNDKLKNIIVEHNFNVGTVKTNAKYTEALVQENEYIWSGKIGLLTLSEFLYPSTISTSTQDITIGTTAYSNNYLLNYASGKFLWTANALNNNSSSVWVIGKDLIPTPKAANLATETIENVSYNYIALPSAYINSTVEYSSGDGTLSNPFTIK